MPQFEITDVSEVLCVDFDTNSKKHGEALVTTQRTVVRWRTKNHALDMLHKSLREHLFSATPDQGSEQGEMALEANDLAFVRFKDLHYPIRWDREFTGYTFHVDYGTGGESNMIVQLCEVKHFDITPHDGGLVDIAFTILSAADITERFIGKMGSSQKKSIFIRLLAPSLLEDDAIDSAAGSGAPGTGPAAEPEKPAKTKTKSDAHRAATDAFIEQNTGDGAAATH